MVVEQTERSADNRLAIATRVPCKSETRSKIVVVSRNSLRDAKQVLRLLRQRSSCREHWCEFNVIPDTHVQCQVARDCPGILEEQSQRLVRELVMWIAYALNQRRWDAYSVRLYRRQ